MSNTMKLRSGATIPQVSREEADRKHYLTRGVLTQMHLMPNGDPAAFDKAEDGSLIYYFDPARVVEAPPEQWYFPRSRKETRALDSGTEIERMSIKRAASCGYYTRERLGQMHYEVVEEPVAFTVKGDGTTLYFYDKKTAVRLPLACVKCGKDVRYRKKLCRACYEEELAIRRAEGDIHRNAYYGMDRKKVLFFDLELTGVYDHDEIISISIVDGEGTVIMDTLVKPAHKKKWKQTEKIHGITPDMVANSPLLDELIPEIKEIFENADNLIAYGVSTDYSHIKYIYDTEEERERLHKKTRCCANEFVRFAHEHLPDLAHASLTDAMAVFEIEWDGVAHTSIADTIGCMKVWEKIFPNYYTEAPDHILEEAHA
ncbi:MAG: 3'-5' exonuclease [Clostridia bacterium]|nr:3'-5' exonuclease [Clostridia bacterium]